MNRPEPACCPPPEKPKPWFLDRIFLVVFAVCFSLLVSYRLPALVPFRVSLLSYLRQIWWMVLLGFLLGGWIDRFVPREYISLVLAEKRKRTVFYSVMLGLLMSVCSHGILALSIELHKKGASTPVVVSFLLASPWANLPITLILLGLFGWKAFYIILGAVFVAFTTGVVFQFLERKRWIESNPKTLAVGRNYSIPADLRRRFKGYRFSVARSVDDLRGILHGAAALARVTLFWVLIGIALSSLAAAFVPPQFFHHYMGDSFPGLLTTLALATVLEVCSEGTAPLAFEIFRQTGAFGNAFVFLMAGVVTDYTEIGLIWSNIGKKTALWIPAVTVPQVVLLGWIANKIFK